MLGIHLHHKDSAPSMPSGGEGANTALTAGNVVINASVAGEAASLDPSAVALVAKEVLGEKPADPTPTAVTPEEPEEPATLPALSPEPDAAEEASVAAWKKGDALKVLEDTKDKKDPLGLEALAAQEPSHDPTNEWGGSSEVDTLQVPKVEAAAPTMPSGDVEPVVDSASTPTTSTTTMTTIGSSGPPTTTTVPKVESPQPRAALPGNGSVLPPDAHF